MVEDGGFATLVRRGGFSENVAKMYVNQCNFSEAIEMNVRSGRWGLFFERNGGAVCYVRRLVLSGFGNVHFVDN